MFHFYKLYCSIIDTDSRSDESLKRVAATNRVYTDNHSNSYHYIWHKCRPSTLWKQPVHVRGPIPEFLLASRQERDEPFHSFTYKDGMKRVALSSRRYWASVSDKESNTVLSVDSDVCRQPRTIVDFRFFAI